MKSFSLHSAHSLTAAMVLAGSLFSAGAQIPWATEPFSRENKFEVYGIAEYLHQDDITYRTSFGDKVKVEMDDTGLGGIGVAWHFNDFFSVHGDFMLGPATFHAKGPGAPSYTVGEDAFIQASRLNLDYNIINRRITPFVTAGIGYQYLQVEEDSPYDNYYYYDDYYYETDFTWNVGAGIRWNITDNLFIKATGGVQWLQYEDAEDVTTQFGASFVIGLTIP